MGSSSFRKAIGVVKDQTSISIAKVSGNIARDVEVLIVKATGHNNEPPEEKYTREILNLTFYSTSYLNACICTISKRLSKTHDWIVALKVLMLIHRLLDDGEPGFGEEMIHVNRNRTRVLNMSDFHDLVHSNSWEHSGFVKTYALYLTRKLEFMAFDQSIANNSSHFEKVLERLHYLLRVLDRVLSCRPTGDAKSSRIVIIALHLVLKESFRVYENVCEMIEVLLQGFSEMEYDIGVKAFDQFVYAAKMSDELVGFYNWCEDIGVARSSEFPNVQKITDEILGSLETFLSERKIVYDNGKIDDIKAVPLPPPESHNPPPPAAMPTEDLLNLKDDANGRLQSVTQEDPFAASLRVLPPLYMWKQYG